MSEKKERDFKGIWIPKELYLDENLNWTEKILLVEIDSLDNEEGCYASNKYFAKFLSKSKVYISNCISKLKEDGYIYQESFDGRKRVLKSNMGVKLKNKAGLNSSLRQDKEKVKGGQPARDTSNKGETDKKNGSNKLLNNKDYKTNNNKSAEKIEKISERYRQVFEKDISLEIYDELKKICDDLDIIYKALLVTEKRTKGVPAISYLYTLLRNWSNKNLNSIGDIDRHLKKRNDYKQNQGSNLKKDDKLHDIKKLEEEGWNS